MAFGISLRTDNEENEVNRFILSWNGDPLFEMRYETDTIVEVFAIQVWNGNTMTKEGRENTALLLEVFEYLFFGARR